VLDDDYKKAGYRLLPLASGRSKSTAALIFISSALLVPISVLPFMISMSGMRSVILLALGSLALTYMAAKLYRSLSIKDAKTLMFASILYNPFVLVVLLIDKI